MRRALSDFRRTWPQLVLTDLLARAVTAAVVGPVIGLALLGFLGLEDDRVLADTEIASYLLHPLGLAALVVVGALTAGTYLARLSLGMVIGFGATEDRRVTYADALRYVIRRAASLVRLAGQVLVRLALVAIPFLAVIGGIYLLLIWEHDINYYLARKPPEFRLALALAGATAAGLLVAATWLVGGWILALPMLLFEGVRGRAALERSRAALEPHRARVVAFLLAWIVGLTVASALVSFVIGRVGGLLIPPWERGWFPAATGLAATLLLAGLANLALQVLADSLLPLLIVRGYRSVSEAPPVDRDLPERGTLGDGVNFQIPGKALVAGILLAPLVASVGAWWLLRRVGTEDTATVIAHRGASAGAPENTMAAFELALETGADWIELDVQENAEGEVIVAHDSDFMRHAGVRLKVWESTARDLEELDVGSSFGASFAGERVPTLRQVLEWAHDRIGLVIELKYYGHDQQLEERVARLVEDTRMQDQIQIMSLQRPGLARMAEVRPDWPRGLLNTASVGDLTRLDVDFLALSSAAATRAQIQRAHARGMQVYVWTIDDPLQMSVMLSRGADGLITNEPAIARKVLDLREDLSPLGRIIVWAAGESGLLGELARPSDETDA